MSGKKPDLTLWVVTQGPSEDRPTIQGTVGAAWVGDDGAITINLNAGIVLDSSKVIRLKLYKPRDRGDAKAREQASAATPSQETRKPAGRFDDMEDDIPF